MMKNITCLFLVVVIVVVLGPYVCSPV